MGTKGQNMKNNFYQTLLLIFTLLIFAGCIQDNLEEFDSEEFVFSDGSTIGGGSSSSTVRAQFLGASSSGEEGAMVDITIFLDKAHTAPVQITADVVSGNAGNGIDYTAIASAVSIPAGQTQGTLKYFLLADQETEGLENFYLKLRSLSSGVAVSSTLHMVNIINKAAGTPTPPPAGGGGTPVADSVVSLAAASASISEAQGLYSIPVILDKAATKNIVLTLTASGTASLGQDYVLVNGTQLSIPMGASTGSIMLQVIDDSAVESIETATISIVSATGATLGSQRSIAVSITDNDMAAPTPPPAGGGGAVDELTAFRETLYNNILRNANTGRCLNCHRPNGNVLRISPFHSHDDPAQALQIIKASGLVNLTNPSASRLVDKVAGGHQSWSGASLNDADAIEAQIVAWVQRMQPAAGGGGTPTPPPVNQGNRIISSAMSVSEGQEVEGTARYMQNQIAFYDFKKGADEKIIYDRSNVAPAMNLEISGDIKWAGGQGITCNQDATNGRATASATASRKLHSRITATDQYTLEAWISSTDPDQDGPTRIMTYSIDSQNRNFTMGQAKEYFSFRNRNAETSNNGTPEHEPQVKFISSRPVNHHVVMVYDGRERKIYVNGALVDVKDPRAAAANRNLDGWNDNYRFGFCNEIQNNVVRAFKGSIYMAAVFDRALTSAQIMQNYQAGFTKKLALEFDISSHTNAGAKLQAQVEVQGSYLIFSEPQFKGLTAPVNVSGIEFTVNGQRGLGAQSYAFLDIASASNGQVLSDVSALIVADNVGTDKIGLNFAELAGKANIQAQAQFPYEGNSVTVESPELTDVSAIKLFSEINQTFANITGVAPSTQIVRDLYQELKTGLPTDQGIDTFSSSQQINIVKLGYEYCKLMISNSSLRSGFYGSISTNQNASQVFNSATRMQVSNAIIDKAIGRDIAGQPTSTEVTQNIDSLISELISQGKTTDEVLTGACVVGLGNMSVLVK